MKKTQRYKIYYIKLLDYFWLSIGPALGLFGIYIRARFGPQYIHVANQVRPSPACGLCWPNGLELFGAISGQCNNVYQFIFFYPFLPYLDPQRTFKHQFMPWQCRKGRGNTLWCHILPPVGLTCSQCCHMPPLYIQSVVPYMSQRRCMYMQ